jgi:hypothetical protein
VDGHRTDAVPDRTKRAEVEQQVLELQAQEEEHLLELNTGQRPEGRRSAPQATGSTTPDGEGNRTSVLNALRQKLSEAQDINSQLEQRLRRAEETLEAVRAARPAAPDALRASELRPAAVADGEALQRDAAAALPRAHAEAQQPQLQPLASEARDLPAPQEGVRPATPQRLDTGERDRRWWGDDQALSDRLAALVPLDASIPGVPAPPPPWLPPMPQYSEAAAPRFGLRGYSPPLQRWDPVPAYDGRLEGSAAHRPGRRAGGGGGGGGYRERDEYGQARDLYPQRQELPPTPPPAPRRAAVRRRGGAREVEEEELYVAGYNQDSDPRGRRREESESPEPVRAAASRRAAAGGRGGGREEEGGGDRARARQRRRGERSGRRVGEGGETDAGEVERLLAAAGLSGYEGVLLRNGWDCMDRLRLIKEADLVRCCAAPTGERNLAVAAKARVAGRRRRDPWRAAVSGAGIDARVDRCVSCGFSRRILSRCLGRTREVCLPHSPDAVSNHRRARCAAKAGLPAGAMQRCATVHQESLLAHSGAGAVPSPRAPRGAPT